MSDPQKLIEIILSDEKLKSGKSFRTGIYRDEPIITTASHMNSYVPPKITELQNEMRTAALRSSERGFYEQALLMQDYEDDFQYSGDFISYFPTYRSMNTRQLRGYFSWRTKVRKGDIRKTSLSFAFVYIYELIHLVGVSSPEEGFEKLADFGKAYGTLDPHIITYIKKWLMDFAVYYDLDKSYFYSVYDESKDKALISLMEYTNRTDEEIFSAVRTLSPYNIEKSKLYKNYSEDFEKIVPSVYRSLSEYSANHRKKSLFENYFGNYAEYPCEMFGSAVFFDKKRYKSFSYVLNDHHRYDCNNGRWSCRKFCRTDVRSKKLGLLVKSIDSLMRKKYGMTPDINCPIDTKLTVGIIENAIDEFLDEKKKNASIIIDIDISKLSSIRHSADITRDKLITESEIEEDIPEEKIIPQHESCDEIDSIPSDIPLDKNEYELLRCLLYEGSVDSLRSRKGIMISLLADSVNEKLFDMFGDTVIIFDGDSPEIIEDYAEELKGIVKK